MFRHVKNIHFIGIGGIGMSGIAEILHNQGYKVHGSDASESANVARLRAMGIDVAIGQSADNLRDHRHVTSLLHRIEQVFPGVLVGVNAHRAVAKIERANVVESENVVDVAMRDQHRVQMPDARPQSLLPKVDRRVD